MRACYNLGSPHNQIYDELNIKQFCIDGTWCYVVSGATNKLQVSCQ